MNLVSGFKVEDAKKMYMKYWGGAIATDEVYSSVRNATTQRGYVYHSQIGGEAKEKMWRDYRSFVEKKIGDYVVGTISESEHLNNLSELVEFMTSVHSDSLKEGHFRFGSAQKLFNLTLKLLWVKGEIVEPLHAPIDSYVAKNVGENYAWTKNDSLDAYVAVIERCKRVAKAYGLSLAQWELLYWNMVVLSATIK
ncbi:hypothetical protein [Pseudodesulfovibrio senegalensis]|uniref:Uncharacterized protein n=1 Tax=Pseudodesulfovibrio senegalensis TaxID=1721087 RepID=A0A6N6N0D9_9BACT|nr:hypothetical protein [Pseudodesulfovibrio senegalensis]KAB1440362.1 hypothetical protein F8A88_14030 [Pseudodesulfovibrio senegalensis]